MRLELIFSKNTEPVSVINQHMVNYYIYGRCLKGDKYYHNAKSDYCISSIYGGKLDTSTKTLDFKDGAKIFITTQNEAFLDKVVAGVLENRELFCGMTFINFNFIGEEFLGGWNHFATLTPFIIKKYISKKEYKFCVFRDENFLEKAKEHMLSRLEVLNDNDFSQTVTEHTKNKLRAINPALNLDEFKVVIKTHPNHKIKTSYNQYDHVNKKCVVNYANQCHVSIFCCAEIAEMIYNLGLGQSTGNGFGTIYKTENHNKYKNKNVLK